LPFQKEDIFQKLSGSSTSFCLPLEAEIRVTGMTQSTNMGGLIFVEEFKYIKLKGISTVYLVHSFVTLNSFHVNLKM